MVSTHVAHTCLDVYYTIHKFQRASDYSANKLHSQEFFVAFNFPVRTTGRGSSHRGVCTLIVLHTSTPLPGKPFGKSLRRTRPGVGWSEQLKIGSAQAFPSF